MVAPEQEKNVPPQIQKLIEARHAAGLSQTQAAAVLGLKQRKLSYFETGAHPMPRKLQQELLAHYRAVTGNRPVKTPPPKKAVVKNTMSVERTAEEINTAQTVLLNTCQLLENAQSLILELQRVIEEQQAIISKQNKRLQEAETVTKRLQKGR